MGWRTLVSVGCAAVLMAACGGSTPAASPTVESTSVTAPATPTLVRTVAPAAASPSALPAVSPTGTPAAAAADTVYVGNTDGQGVFVRKTPAMADRLRAYPDGTALTIAGEDVDGDGQHWHHVKTPDGVEGYVPAMYTVDSPP